MLDDYFKATPGVKDFPIPGIELQSPNPEPVVMAMSYNDPNQSLNKPLPFKYIFCYFDIFVLLIQKSYLQMLE